MITLSQYARDIYEFATKEVEAHIVETVVLPLGLANEVEGARKYLSTFASPPATTNIRFTGSHISERGASTCAEVSETATRYHSETMKCVGLPYCVCLHPVDREVPQWPPLLSRINHGREDSEARTRSPAIVVVDPGCGEAVLRGADVFLPGVCTFSRPFAEGHQVLLGVYLEKTTHRAGLPAAAAFHFKFPTRHPIPAEALMKCEAVRSKPGESARYLVLIGEGIARVNSNVVVAPHSRGVAVKVTWTPLLQPSLNVLENIALSGVPVSAERPVATLSTNLFLQNYSSMVPVQLLANRVGPTKGETPLMLFDACAAPGGKASLLLSLMKDADERNTPGSCESHFRLVCCERSQRRYDLLVDLLKRHFAEDKVAEGGSSPIKSFLSQTLRALAADANKLPAALREADPTLAPVFDGILLDPPCSGMGLRPRLQPHDLTKRHIADYADYQRALFRSCMRYLRPDGTTPAIIVYSTCTITLEENEANVLYFLQTFPSLKLARASSPSELALCAMATVSYNKDGKRFLLEDDIMRIQKERETDCPVANNVLAPVLVLRFTPRLANEAHFTMEDGVGFFVAVFEKMGSNMCVGFSS